MPLLANEQCFVVAAIQYALAGQRLIPVRNEVEALFLSLRNALDPKLCHYRPATDADETA